MQSMKPIFVISVLTALAGCSSTGTVMSVGPDTYMVTSQQHNMAGGAAGAQTNALAEANAKCSAEGKQVLVRNTESGFARPFYTYSITFRCLATGDRELQRPTFEQSPDVVIQTK